LEPSLLIFFDFFGFEFEFVRLFDQVEVRGRACLGHLLCCDNGASPNSPAVGVNLSSRREAPCRRKGHQEKRAERAVAGLRSKGKLRASCLEVGLLASSFCGDR